MKELALVERRKVSARGEGGDGGGRVEPGGGRSRIEADGEVEAEFGHRGFRRRFSTALDGRGEAAGGFRQGLGRS